MLGSRNDHANLYGNTPLHYAAHAGNRNKVIELLNDGCNVLQKNGSGLTPLHFAAFGGCNDILERLLLQAPSAINIQSIKGSTLLHEAVRGKSIDVVKFLIKNGSDVNLQDEDGNTPLHLTGLVRPSPTVVDISQALLEGGSDPKIQNRSNENFFFNIVRAAAAAGQSPSSELLVSLALKYLPDLLIRNMDGLTVLDVARKVALPQNVIIKIQARTQEGLNLLLHKRPFRRIQSSPDSGVVSPDESLSHRRFSNPEGFVSSIDSFYKLGKRAKLFVCGHSRVGKTTFTNTLRQSGLLSKFLYLFDSKSPSSTEGVSLSQTDLEGGPFVIWDFAGQMEYYFTHSLLLQTSGANTVYCVIFNLEGIESDHSGGQSQTIKEIIFWLRLLSVTRSSDSRHHLILIGSHLDTLKEECRSKMANCFFSSLMKKELDLFKCFKIQFFPMNCKSMNDMQPVREELGKIVSQILQESLADTVPDICQAVMEQVRRLIRHKIRFLQWKDFSQNVALGLSMTLCTNTLLTAVEYLHNISELLYLPQCCSSNASDTLNCVFSSSPSKKPATMLSHISHNDIHTCSALTSCSCPSGVPPPSGLVVLDLPWLLQKICGRFGNFLLSPATGQEKEFWSLSEMESALELQDVERDTETALHLLQSLEFLLQTDQGYYVVPAWLRREGPTEQMVLKNVKGVVYRWQETSRGIFSQFLVGQLQIWLLRKFGSQRCRLWREGAQCIAQAVVRIEISDDRRSLFMTGGWDEECSDGICYQLLEMVGMEVENLLRKCQDQGWERLHLISKELLGVNNTVRMDVQRDSLLGTDKLSLLRGSTGGLRGFSWDDILEAERQCKTLCGRYVEAQP